MEESEIQTEQEGQEEGQKELTVDDLETIAGGAADDGGGAEIGEVGGDAGIKDIKSDNS